MWQAKGISAFNTHISYCWTTSHQKSKPGGRRGLQPHRLANLSPTSSHATKGVLLQVLLQLPYSSLNIIMTHLYTSHWPQNQNNSRPLHGGRRKKMLIYRQSYYLGQSTSRWSPCAVALLLNGSLVPFKSHKLLMLCVLFKTALCGSIKQKLAANRDTLVSTGKFW